jgi:hypothetical protein
MNEFLRRAERTYARLLASSDCEPPAHNFRVSILLVASMDPAAFVLGFALAINSAHKNAPVAADSKILGTSGRSRSPIGKSGIGRRALLGPVIN